MLHRAYLIYRGCFQSAYLTPVDADNALFVRAQSAAQSLVDWAKGGTTGRLDRETAESCLTTVRAMRELVRDCGGNGLGVHGQAATTTALEKFFAVMRNARGFTSGTAGSMDLQGAAKMSTMLAVEDFYAMAGAFREDGSRRILAAAVEGANSMGAGADDMELLASCQYGLLSKAAAKAKVAEELAAARAVWEAEGKSPTVSPVQLRLSCVGDKLSFFKVRAPQAVAEGAAAPPAEAPNKATLDNLFKVSLQEPPRWTFTGLNYGRLELSTYAGLHAVPAVLPTAPSGRTPVRSNKGLLDAFAIALRLPPPGHQRLAPLAFHPTEGAASVSVDDFPSGFFMPPVDTSRRAAATAVRANFLAATLVLAMEHAIKSSLTIRALLQQRGDYARALLRALTDDAEVTRLVTAATVTPTQRGGALAHEVYELAWIVGSWYVRVAWQKLNSARVAQHMEAAKARDPSRAGDLRKVIAAVSAAASSSAAGKALGHPEEEV